MDAIVRILCVRQAGRPTGRLFPGAGGGSCCHGSQAAACGAYEEGGGPVQGPLSVRTRVIASAECLPDAEEVGRRTDSLSCVMRNIYYAGIPRQVETLATANLPPYYDAATLKMFCTYVHPRTFFVLPIPDDTRFSMPSSERQSR